MEKVNDLPVKTKLICYVCGEFLSDKFVLATMALRTDRPFTLHSKCAEQLERGTGVIAVQLQINKKERKKINE